MVDPFAVYHCNRKRSISGTIQCWAGGDRIEPGCVMGVLYRTANLPGWCGGFGCHGRTAFLLVHIGVLDLSQ